MKPKSKLLVVEVGVPKYKPAPNTKAIERSLKLMRKNGFKIRKAR